MSIFQNQTALLKIEVHSSQGSIPASIYLLWCWPTLTTVELIQIFSDVPWVACLVVPEINSCDSWHATYAGCIWPMSFLCASARRQCYNSATCFLLLCIGFISLVLICSCSHCGMGVCCSMLGACTQACWAALELPEWTVVAFCTWSLVQRTEFCKDIEVFIFMWNEKPLLISCAVFICGLCVYLRWVLLPFALSCSFCTEYDSMLTSDRRVQVD